MGVGQDIGPLLPQGLQAGESQSPAFLWVGPGAQLVQKQKGTRHAMVHHALEGLQLRGVSAQVIRQALAVGKVTIKMVEKRDLASVLDRDRNPGLGHHPDQP